VRRLEACDNGSVVCDGVGGEASEIEISKATIGGWQRSIKNKYHLEGMRSSESEVCGAWQGKTRAFKSIIRVLTCG
jgi:hypothetical protein